MRRAVWDERHDSSDIGQPEPSLLEFLPMLPQGSVLDVAAGKGRHSIVLARHRMRVVATDWSEVGLKSLLSVARKERLSIEAVGADLEQSLPFRAQTFDLVVNINFLARALFPLLKSVLRIGGMLFFDTFTIDQAAIGHPRDPRFLLGHYELRNALSDMELVCYREGLVDYGEGRRAWRAMALARRTA
jgi:tellurite methyltransferase